jgi:riboflavin synthase
MFTGIIAGTGKLLERKNAGGGLVFRLEAGFALTDPKEGESIAVNGTCLTAYDIDGRRFSVDLSPESVTRTTLGGLQTGAIVNLERALRLSDRLGGHLVSGHVDCVARVTAVKSIGNFTIFTFVLGDKLSRYLIEKGSVTVDGISLTVNECMGERFSVSIIPHTMQTTTLAGLKTGSLVNIEVDIIGKYVEKLLSTGSPGPGVRVGGINPGFLAEHGFL